MKIHILILLVLVLLIASCVYYNTFFNAEKYFEEAQQMDLNDSGRPTQAAISKYNKSIKKCGIVLEYYEGSKYSDDALLLMAKSFYYIGRNYTQAISILEDMVLLYQDSELVPEAKLYIAQAKYSLLKEEEAYDLLHEFLLNNQYKSHHPKALMILANYKLLENDYIQTEYYLNKLLDDYPNSKQYEEAFFLQGKSQTEARNYQKSITIFNKLMKTRVSRKTKFDARYYIALNYLSLEKFQKAADYSSALLKDEYRENKLAGIQLIKARSLAELGELNEAIAILEAITEDNKRSRISGEAFYFLGNIYFYKMKDYSKAIEYYNKVKGEDRNSKYLESAVSQSAIASQIIQYYNPDTKISASELIDQQFKLAEFYIEYLSMPDSALIVYNNIINQKMKFITSLDTLQLRLDSLLVVLDSVSLADSLVHLTKNDTVDSEDKKAKSNLKNKFQTDYNALKNTIENIQENIKLYQNEFIPFATFSKLWLYKNILSDSVMVNSILNVLSTDYPDNKYTFAAVQFLAGKDSILIATRKQIKEAAEYNKAIRYLDSQPAKTVELLRPIVSDINNEFREQAIYSLGYINYFILEDSLAAKPYFDSVLTISEMTPYKSEVRKFYDGENFIKISRLPYIEQLLQADLEKQRSEQEDNEEQKPESKEVIEEQQKGKIQENISPIKGEINGKE
ncbi:MAG: tetratricopeptide repeat protein [Candidatus Cloacimonetes bacterium]|nr:tetratricopeptide repeat protein [Candidatus Cloacimonadota bacterium]